jgi:hypothetical protein
MTRRAQGIRLLAVAAACLCTCTLLRAQVNVTTYHNDVARTGQNTQETILTPANVNYTQFGKLFSVAVDGVVYAQPLYLSAVTIAGGTHNVLYVVTEHDSVYAIDADSGTVYAQVSLIPSGGSTVNSDSDIHCGDLVPEVGITGTPVIDPTTGTLYVVAASKVSGAFYQYLHALDIGSLAEKFNGPVAIQASVPGTGYDSSGGVVSFNPLQENQRTALLLEGGHVVMGWSSHCDNDPWHGWVMSYSAGTLAQEAAFNTSPNGSRNGVWMSGAGASADASGNIYFATGNGTWNGTTDYGDSIVKLGAPSGGSFPVLDYFTPYNQGTLAADDVDLASGGLALLPALPSGVQLLAQQGKQGTIYLLNTAHLGNYCPNLAPACSGHDTNVVQEIMGASPGIWGSPAYWNGNLYWTGANDHIKAYSFNAGGSGLISTSPTSRSAQIFAFSAPTPVISANGTSNGILWALDGSADDSTCDGGGSNCLGLYAYDATNLANVLYTSSQASGNRDSPGVAVKFESPIIANGKVYVGTQSSVTVYGLLAGALPQAATPTFNPAPGAYLTPQTLMLADATPGASIYYTTNGATPTASSTRYTGPFQVGSTEIINAIAIAAGYSQSSTAEGIYDLPEAPPAVNLSAEENIDAIGISGSIPPNGGIDGAGDAYVASLIGSSISWNGSTFALGAANSLDAVSNAVIPLPAGNYSALNVLGTGVNGNQPNQTFVVTYSDGSTTSFVQSMSSWTTPQKYTGESRVLDMADRVGPTGKLTKGSYYLYGYTFALDSSKTAISLTLPNNKNVVILGVDVSNTAVGDAAGFTTSNGLTFVHGAARAQETLELTEKSLNLARAIWTASPVNVQNFATDFTFQITPASANLGDGMTFTLQNAGPTACGAADTGQGYAGITSSVAVKFDLLNDAGEGPDSTGFYVNGASPTVPAFDLRPSGVNLHSGDVMHAHITYDGTTLTLVLTDTVTGASFTAAQAINIPATVGGNTAYAGFTGSTGTNGNQVSVQQILSWTYTSGATPVVNYPTGFTQSAPLTLTGGVTLAGSALELTTGAGDEATSAWTQTPVNVQKFTTDFNILESAASADGFTFTLQNAGPSAVGLLGGGLGYAGIGTSVAIKFDLYNNAGEGTDSTGFYVNGASPMVPALDMTASGVNLHGSDPLHAHINYDGVTLTLTLTDIVTGATFSASQAINIPATVGGNTAYVGFTAGTGGQTAVQQILSWTYVVN